MTICGIVAAVVSTSALLSAIGLVQWLITMAAFAVVLALWRPSPPIVATLAWSYVAGHVVSRSAASPPDIRRPDGGTA